MLDKKSFLLMVLLLSQVSQAQQNMPSDIKVERKLVQTVMSEDEVKFLLQKRILVLLQDGTLSINKEAIKTTKENGYKSGTATDSVICLHGE